MKAETGTDDSTVVVTDALSADAGWGTCVGAGASRAMGVGGDAEVITSEGIGVSAAGVVEGWVEGGVVSAELTICWASVVVEEAGEDVEEDA